MPIISISMDEETLEELDRLERSMAFAGRSEAVRAGVRTLIAENKATEKLSGRVKAVLLMAHDRSDEEKATEVKHDFEDIVSTQVHTSLSDGKCLELFVLEGPAGRLAQMVRQAQSNRKVGYVKLIVP